MQLPERLPQKVALLARESPWPEGMVGLPEVARKQVWSKVAWLIRKVIGKHCRKAPSEPFILVHAAW